MSESSHYRAIAIQPGVRNPKAHEIHANATIFVNDAEALGKRASAGQYFLLVHGIELALKSFLHDNGLSLDDLQRLRHDLDDLLRESAAKGLVCSEPDAARIVERLNEANRKAKLRYEFEFHLPDLDDVKRVARGLLKDTEPQLPPLR